MTRSILIALSLVVACTSLDARESDRTKNADDGKPAQGDTTLTAKPKPEPQADPKPQPQPDKSAAVVDIAIASVQLDQDCPDPASPAPAGEAPATPPVPPSSVVAPNKRAPPSASSAPPGPGSSAMRRACQQSTMVLELTNRSASEAKVRIVGIALRDVQSNSTVGDVASRGPSVFRDGSYVAWDERVAASGTLNASYKLTPPDWSNVATALGGGVDTRERNFELEVTFEVDGKAQTMRSTSFRRPPQLVMPPT